MKHTYDVSELAADQHAAQNRQYQAVRTVVVVEQRQVVGQTGRLDPFEETREAAVVAEVVVVRMGQYLLGLASLEDRRDLTEVATQVGTKMLAVVELLKADRMVPRLAVSLVRERTYLWADHWKEEAEMEKVLEQ